MRKYDVNENYFKIWTPNMAYVLGVIASDGCVYNNQIRIGVSLNDIKWLEDIKLEMGVSNKIYKREKDSIALLCIYSKTMTEDLKALGITSNKSKTLTFPNIPKEYDSHFIRGYFDGDGWVGFSKDKSNFTSLAVSICGTNEFLKQIKYKFNEKFNNTVGSLGNGNKCFQLRFNGNKSSKLFLDWIYNESNIELDRKAIIYKEIKSS